MPDRPPPLPRKAVRDLVMGAVPPPPPRTADGLLAADALARARVLPACADHGEGLWTRLGRHVVYAVPVALPRPGWAAVVDDELLLDAAVSPAVSESAEEALAAGLRDLLDPFGGEGFGGEGCLPWCGCLDELRRERMG